jgi:hypothetical protein
LAATTGAATCSGSRAASGNSLALSLSVNSQSQASGRADSAGEMRSIELFNAGSSSDDLPSRVESEELAGKDRMGSKADVNSDSSGVPATPARIGLRST